MMDYAAIREEREKARRAQAEAEVAERRAAMQPILDRIEARKQAEAAQASAAESARLAKLDAQTRALEETAKRRARLLWRGTTAAFEAAWPGLWQEELAQRLRTEQASQRPLVRL